MPRWGRPRREMLRREALRWKAPGAGGGPPAWLEWPGWPAVLYGVHGIWGCDTLLVMAFANAPHVEANILNYTWTLWIVAPGALLPGHRLTGPIVAAGGRSAPAQAHSTPEVTSTFIRTVISRAGTRRPMSRARRLAMCTMRPFICAGPSGFRQ